MRSYHLTPKQAFEIADELELAGLDITAWEDGYVRFENKTALQSFANAVLDQVLGEPVAQVSINESGQIFIKRPDGYIFDISKHVGTKLYAPKGQS